MHWQLAEAGNRFSELRRTAGNARVLRWTTELDTEDVFLSGITIGELTKGAALLPENQRLEATGTMILDPWHE